MAELSGSLSSFELTALVRFLCGLGKSGDLLVSHGRWIGQLSVESGRLSAAGVEDEHGPAALEFMSAVMRGGDFEFSEGPPSLAPNLDGGADPLGLLERVSAPWLAVLPAPTDVPRLVPMGTQNDSEVALGRAAIYVLLDVDGSRTVRELAARHGLLRVLRALVSLHEVGLVSFDTPRPSLDGALAGAPQHSPRPGLDGALAGASQHSPRPSLDRAPAGAPQHSPRPGLDRAPAGAPQHSPRTGLDGALAGASQHSPRPGLDRAPADAPQQPIRPRLDGALAGSPQPSPLSLGQGEGGRGGEGRSPWEVRAYWRDLTRARPFAIGLELAQAVVFTGVLLFGIRTVVQNFRVEGTSMQPNFEGGQALVVNRAAYFHVERTPFAQILPTTRQGSTQYVFGGPQRGDVVVFRAPPQPDTDYIKRLIGLPGETVLITQGLVFIDGARLDEPYVDFPASYNFPASGQPTVVPDGNYFVLGDNRPDSFDSHQWGFVPVDNLIGRAWLRYWPPNELGTVQPTPPAEASSTTASR